MRRWTIGAVALAMVGSLAAASGARVPRPVATMPADLTVDRVVLLMRHGVRPPTKAPPMPAKVAAQAWPIWPVAPGWLTPHGAAAIARLGEADGARLRAQGVLPPRGCPAAGAIAAIADSDQRTIATAEAWLGAVAPACSIASTHLPQDAPDPLFGGAESNAASFDPKRADGAVAQALGKGGIAAVERAQRPLLARLDQILCGQPTPGCGVGGEPTAIVPAAPGKRPKLAGALDRASTAAQILLLEYAEGKPAAEVGWGRATAADITTLSAFHALEFQLLARPRYIAAANLGGLIARMTTALADPAATTRVTMISGHDTQIASLGGLLGVHWHVPGFAEDDPSPGGAIVIERLSDAHGAQFVRAYYRSQTLDQIRSAAPLGASTYRAPLAIPGCRARGVAGLCTIEAFKARLSAD